jgi:hypothetical protein
VHYAAGGSALPRFTVCRRFGYRYVSIHDVSIPIGTSVGVNELLNHPITPRHDMLDPCLQSGVAERGVGDAPGSVQALTSSPP